MHVPSSVKASAIAIIQIYWLACASQPSGLHDIAAAASCADDDIRPVVIPRLTVSSARPPRAGVDDAPAEPAAGRDA